MGEAHQPPTLSSMLIDTDRLADQLQTAASVVTALEALRGGLTDAQWESIEKQHPALGTLLDACADLEWMLTP